MSKRAPALFVAVVICIASAGTKSAGSLAPCGGQALFIESMPENFGQYITTEIMSQNLKLTVTTDETKGVCAMRGTVALGGFRNTGSASLQVIGPGKNVIWSATSGDKDSIKDLAHNLVRQLKHDLQAR
jgi:hypothetical protein